LKKNGSWGEKREKKIFPHGKKREKTPRQEPVIDPLLKGKGRGLKLA